MKKILVILLINVFLINKPVFAISKDVPQNEKIKLENIYSEIDSLENINYNNLLNRAYLYSNIGKIDKSIEIANILLEKNKEDSALFFLLGKNYKNKCELNKAKVFFQKIKEEQKEYNQALVKLMEIAVLLDDKQDANIILQKIENTKNQEFIYLIGSIYYYSHFDLNFDKASDILEKGLILNSKNTDLIFYLASVNLTKDNRKEAKKLFKKVIELDFLYDQAHAFLSFVEFLDKNFDKSFHESKIALEINPYNLRALTNLGNGMTTKNYKLLEESNSNLKANEEFFLAGKKSYELINNGKIKEANELIDNIVKKYPDNIHSYIHLCSLKADFLDYDSAIKYCKKAIDISEDYGLAYNLTENTLRKYIKYQIKDSKTLNVDIYDYSSIDINLLKKVFINYDFLDKKDQKTLMYSIYNLRKFLPILEKKGATHYIIPHYEKMTDTEKTKYLKNELTMDGRLWDDVRGMGGLDSATGIEDLEESLYFDFNTLTHEFAHQIHQYALEDKQIEKIKELYEKAKKNNTFIDYYSSTNEYEYFAQAIEAYSSTQGKKNPKSTAKNTPEILKKTDPDIYDFVEKLVK